MERHRAPAFAGVTVFLADPEITLNTYIAYPPMDQGYRGQDTRLYRGLKTIYLILYLASSILFQVHLFTTRPASNPVYLLSSTTISPLTKTYLIPSASSLGRSKVERALIVASSKTITSA